MEVMGTDVEDGTSWKPFTSSSTSLNAAHKFISFQINIVAFSEASETSLETASTNLEQIGFTRTKFRGSSRIEKLKWISDDFGWQFLGVIVLNMSKLLASHVAPKQVHHQHVEHVLAMVVSVPVVYGPWLSQVWKLLS